MANDHLFMVHGDEDGQKIEKLDVGSIRKTLTKCTEAEVKTAFFGFQEVVNSLIFEDHHGYTSHIVYVGY